MTLGKNSSSYIKVIPTVLLSIALLQGFVTSAAEKKQIDLIVYGDYVVTMSEGMSEQNQVINKGAVAISQNEIVMVAQASTIDQLYQAKRSLSGEGKILLPGLINGHTHSAMTLFRGMADDLKLMTWLNNYIFPMEAQFVNREFVATGARLACWEMIQGGTTTFVDMYFYPDTISQVIVDCGLRAIIGSPSIDFPSPGFKGWDDSFAAAVTYVNNWQNRHERITPAFAPHAPYTVSAKHLEQLASKARELKAPVTIHLAESSSETEMINQRYNTSPVNHVVGLGLMDDITLIAAHMVFSY